VTRWKRTKWWKRREPCKTMLIGSLQVEVFFPDVGSLKEKRYIMQSVKTKIQNRFNVSVAEVDHQDKWQRACLGVACVSSDKGVVDSMLQKVLDVFYQEDRLEVLGHVMEVL